MAINLKGLQLAEKQVREVINTPQGIIEVYEPSVDALQAIIDLQSGNGFGFVEQTVSFDGRDVIKKLFPLLTNIELGDLSDEEIDAVIENPTVHFLIAQQIVAQIVAEANKVYAERMKTEMKNAESTVAQIELMNQIPAMLIEKAKSEGNLDELMKAVDNATTDLEEAIKGEEEGKEETVSE